MCRPWSVLLVVVLAASVWVSPAQEPSRMNDDEFVEWLGAADRNEPVDRKRLTRLLFSIAAALEGGRTSVQLLQARVVLPEGGGREFAASELAASYKGYARDLGNFRQHVSALLDEPESRILFYQSLVAGQRTCWRLDLYTRMAASYMLTRDDLMTVFSSREACGRFRTAAFQPRVEAIIMDALVEQVYQRERIRQLREEIREAEALIEELRRIDASE